MLISLFILFLLFIHCQHSLGHKNPPKIFIAARAMAKKPKVLEVLNILSEFPDKPAIIAPTIITDDIALVTDIKGV